MNEIQVMARVKAIEISRRSGGIHFGGIFSIIDLFLAFYTVGKDKLVSSGQFTEYYLGKHNPIQVDMFMSKGHCYLSQLIALDIVYGLSHYTDRYMQSVQYCGHPKRDESNFHFSVSSGALGQCVTVANGVALAKKLKSLPGPVIAVVGDGELNEGSVVESVRFAAAFQLPIYFVVDDNNQISLDKNILGLIDYKSFSRGLGIDCIEVDGHSWSELTSLCKYFFSLTSEAKPHIVRLKTIKGKGVSFMEGNFMWHHRRAKEAELLQALEELGV